MSLDAYLNQTCTITRDVETGTDRYNNAARTPFTAASNVHCRKVQKSMRMMDELTGEYAFVRADLVLLPPGIVVKPKDVITIGAAQWLVKTPLIRQRANDQHHTSCIVEAVNATA